MREVLQTFANRIEFKLQENDDKPHWNDLTFNLLHHMLNTSNNKLQLAVCSNDPAGVIKHSVNVAAYSMMLCDKAAALQLTKRTHNGT